MKINIILPYKETYTRNFAGAVSLLVADIKNKKQPYEAASLAIEMK